MAPDFLSQYPIAFPVVAGAIGLLVGSFLNVCIYRIPRDLSVVAPRSACPDCGAQIAWHDNVPVLSYALLRGRCRACRSAIGLRYPLVEMLTAILFAMVAARYGWQLASVKWMLFESLLVVLFWTDFDLQILPDEFTIGGSVAGLILAFFVKVPSVFGAMFFPGWKPAWQSFFNAVLGAVLLAGSLWLLGVVYTRVRKRDGLGFGDVKLLMLFGVFLGLEHGLSALLVGAVAGSVIGVAYALWARKKLSETELPFGSFLCVGAALIPLLNTFSTGFQTR